jgi:hypothetical protein
MVDRPDFGQRLVLSRCDANQQPRMGTSGTCCRCNCQCSCFLVCLFLLQTRFRPEMLEDVYYSKHLERVSSQTKEVEVLQYSVTPGHGELRQVPLPRLLPGNTADIMINDLLPNVAELEERLRQKGIFSTSKFGSASLNATQPNPFIITIGDSVSPTILREVIAESIPFGLKAVRRATSGWNLHEGRIYIGSYSYENWPLKREWTAKELAELVDDKKSAEEFLALLPLEE